LIFSKNFSYILRDESASRAEKNAIFGFSVSFLVKILLVVEVFTLIYHWFVWENSLFCQNLTPFSA